MACHALSAPHLYMARELACICFKPCRVSDVSIVELGHLHHSFLVGSVHTVLSWQPGCCWCLRCRLLHVLLGSYPNSAASGCCVKAGGMLILLLRGWLGNAGAFLMGVELCKNAVAAWLLLMIKAGAMLLLLCQDGDLRLVCVWPHVKAFQQYDPVQPVCREHDQKHTMDSCCNEQ